MIPGLSIKTSAARVLYGETIRFLPTGAAPELAGAQPRSDRAVPLGGTISRR